MTRISSAPPTCWPSCATTISSWSKASASVKDLAEAAKDNATSGIVDEWTDQAEERAWFLFEASRKA